MLRTALPAVLVGGGGEFGEWVGFAHARTREGHRC